MNHLRNSIGGGLLLIALALFVGACSSGPAELHGAVYPDQIPVYQSARVTDVMGGTTSDLDGSDAHHSASWWLESSDSRKEIEAWYEKQLPNASRMVEDWGDGPVTVYAWAPQGGKPGEELSIVISDADIQITETIQGTRQGW